MKCANSACDNTARDLFEGTLWLVERHAAPQARLRGDEDGFPVCAVPSRYFWLCPDCSGSMKIQGWTAAGIQVIAQADAKKPVTAEALAGDVSQAGAALVRRA